MRLTPRGRLVIWLLTSGVCLVLIQITEYHGR